MDENSTIDPEIAAAMGFAAFGSSANSKKRKANAAKTDSSDPAMDAPFPSKTTTMSNTSITTSQIDNDATMTDALDTVGISHPLATGLLSGTAGSPPAAPSAGKKLKGDTGGLAEFVTRGQQIHAIQPASNAGSMGDSQIGPDWNTYRTGVRNEHGDMVYFKPSFLEDPWKGLSPVTEAEAQARRHAR